MTGLNTQGVQNFSVIFNTTGQNPFPSDQTLLIFTRCNVIVVYTKDGVKVIGKWFCLLNVINFIQLQQGVLSIYQLNIA